MQHKKSPFRRTTVTGVVGAATAFTALCALTSAATASPAVPVPKAGAGRPGGGAEAGGGAGKAQPTAGVSGQGRLFFAYAPDDDIRFSVEATAAPFSRPLDQLPKGMPTDARGTVTIYHWKAGNNDTRRGEAAVDCLVTAGDTATLSAVVTKSADPREIGKRMGFSVKTGGPGKGRFGFDWAVSNVDVVDGKTVAPRVGTCMAPAPFAPIVKGGFSVTHAELPPLPAGWQPGGNG
ncbi:hypothetical protein Q3V23_35665 [Streptomyces sp. VNUA116]|uniref:hypothetical protein n=1 Tax=Streptomyces sp. VNUA116 TaxID=3062449 RepID=UPI0026772A19|nr:hypothetical protein [Streptomyces sp. VNUA116]WKU48980.1 hypothetical protein Q3V23_35665 [Streptomyces sp. VNUA116]